MELNPSLSNRNDSLFRTLSYELETTGPSKRRALGGGEYDPSNDVISIERELFDRRETLNASVDEIISNMNHKYEKTKASSEIWEFKKSIWKAVLEVTKKMHGEPSVEESRAYRSENADIPSGYECVRKHHHSYRIAFLLAEIQALEKFITVYNHNKGLIQAPTPPRVVKSIPSPIQQQQQQDEEMLYIASGWC